MKKLLRIRFTIPLLATFLGVLFLSASSAHAQGIGIPTTVYRFLMQHNDGTFLTTHPQEGFDRGYLYWDIVGTVMVPPAPGWTPVPGQGLAPVYRWRINHSGGVTYYYSGGLWPNLLNCSDCTLESLEGYALVPSEAAGGLGVFLHLWYSQDKGYFYTPSSSANFIPGHPPGTYGWQGVAGRLPFGFTLPLPGFCVPQIGCYQFVAPGSPGGGGEGQPSGCDQGQMESCVNNGGTWNSESCSCTNEPILVSRLDPKTMGWEPPGKNGEPRPVNPSRQVMPF